MDIDFHQLNLTRGSSYVPLPQWLSNKKATINPAFAALNIASQPVKVTGWLPFMPAFMLTAFFT